jgi:hypothetical protein
MDFLNWYKNKIESANEEFELPEELWDDIQNDLDIDLVHRRLNNSLTKDRQKAWLWRGSVAAGILLLLSLGSIYLFTPYSNHTPIAQNEYETIQSDTILKPAQTIDIIIPIIQPGITDVSLIAENNASLSKKTGIKLSETLSTSQPYSAYSITASNSDRITNNLMGSIETTKFVLPKPKYTAPPINLSANNTFVYEHPASAQKILENRQPFSKITIALTGEFANTWLLNNKTLEGLQPQEFTATQPTYSRNYGLSVAANINNKWDIVSQLKLARDNSQTYHEYIHGKYVSNTINLEYFDVALTGRYHPFSNNPEHAFSTGLYTGLLQKATQNINGSTSNITSDYANIDFGLIAGYEYQTPLSDQITLGAGLFYRMGLKNVFSGNKIVAADLNRSYNTSFNFSLSIGYTISL